MSKITLFGGLHNTPDKSVKNLPVSISSILLGPESDKVFFERWLPSVEEKNTLVIIEGSFHKEILTWEDFRYEEEVQTVSPLWFASELGPDILCADTRFKTKQSGQKITADYFKLMTYFQLNPPFGLSYIPKSLEEMIDRYLRGLWFNDCGRTSTADLPPDITRLILSFERSNTEMEHFMLEQASKYENEYEQIFVVTGGSHALEMSKISQLPCVWLAEQKNRTPDEIGNLYAMLLLRICDKIV